MSNVEIRCPRCGAPCALKNKATNEYECAHCESTFRFLDPTQKTVLRGTIAHNCPTCGAPVKDGEGFVCTECGKDWLCKRCAKKFEQKYVCSDCLKEKYVISGMDKVCPKCNQPLQYDQQKKQLRCYHPCFKYVTHVCPECGCVMEYVSSYKDFYCHNCKMYPSYKPKESNQQTATFLVASQYGGPCSRCGKPLTFVPQYQRWYCYSCSKYA
jgi:hypothetical protein